MARPRKAATPSKIVSPSPRQEARAAFQRTLLAAAESVFSRAGFQVTKMADVAAEAKVAVGTLYNYFPSKEAMFESIMDAHACEFQAQLAPALLLPSPIERLRGIVRASFAHIETHGALFAVFVERGGMAEYDVGRVGGQCAAGEYDRFLQVLTDTMQSAVRAGELRDDVPVATLVAGLSGTMNGLVYAWLKSRRKGSLQDVTSEVFELFLSGARA